MATRDHMVWTVNGRRLLEPLPHDVQTVQCIACGQTYAWNQYRRQERHVRSCAGLAWLGTLDHQEA